MAVELNRELGAYPAVYPATGGPTTLTELARITGGELVELSAAE